MPRARRRRRSAAQQGVWRLVLIAVLVAVVVGLLVGSVEAISGQSSRYRTTTDAGYVAMASPVATASSVTGSALGRAVGAAAGLAAGTVPKTARAEFQQQLDDAVRQSADEATRAAALSPPDPTADLGTALRSVMDTRAAAAAELRSTVDGLLGMSPRPIAGAPDQPPVSPAPVLLSATRASTLLASVGSRLQRADAAYGALRAEVVHLHLGRRLPASAWVPPPTASSPLSTAQLTAAPAALAASPGLAATDQVIVSAAGLEPPAVPPSGSAGTVAGASGVLATSCASPSSVVPGPVGAVVPPTGTLSVATTLTNCGNVDEPAVTVRTTLTLSDPPGTPSPPPAAAGTREARTLSLRAGRSTALTVGPLVVAGGHAYLLRIQVTLPSGQADPAGTVQELLIGIAAS